MTGLVGIAYCSISVDFSFHTMEEILSVSQERNLGAGLTGALVYDNRVFLQWLEGAPSDIRAVFSRISRDPRHTGIKLLSVQELRTRLFPRWSMTAALTQGQTLRGLKLVPHLSLAEFDPAAWSEADVACFMEALGDYLSRRPATPRSEPIAVHVTPRRTVIDALGLLDQGLGRIGRHTVN